MEYYRTKEGKVKKRMQNSKRKLQQKGVKLVKSLKPEASASNNAVGYDVDMVDHIRMMTSMLEGREVSLEEVFEMLERQEKRQHSINGKEKSEYRDCELNENSS
jgi:hypothetical protein